MTEENIQTGGRSARKAVQEAGFEFSETLKKELEEKIAKAAFRSENASAIAQADMPTSAGKFERELAAARPWSGTERVEDASSRMLHDAHRPLHGAQRTTARVPKKVDTGRPSKKVNIGVKLASAKERSSIYTLTNEEAEGLTEEERDKFRQEMKARFQSGARSVPASLSGIAALANERIEDAIARGKFKNLPRGKKIERDYNASSPFIDTTEYFLNGIIQRQDILPPLRNDWKRHVARVISSRGGTLESKIKLAEEYAFAESLENPSKKQVEQFNAVNTEGNLTQITITTEPKLGNSANSATTEEEIKIVEDTFDENGSLKPPEQVIVSKEQPSCSQAIPPTSPRRPTVPAFRDPQWLQTERPYHELAVKELNGLTRSYNLMAPDLAKKPYFSVERELQKCYADVAPQVAATIRERALTPKIKGIEVIGHRPGGVLDKFSMDKASHVYDERKPQYGWKEFWRDLFAPKT
ncbi:uncharacterized protein RCC_00790 [Ramularia collo-cygni]|uniref:DnaJ homologue subfamily C member 28 conserved domain-containing protein n=1 Tax=Ramularia collo-cygni TaxID=112498 RepID=A0A2D3ULG8_9PEZI|nr:uncharacterized protein RCC_00790 [Ramularia collo-cygni]CZT14852.1 uncharacterized protein RCC_00790 [Ramularia collo-cygni]